MSNEAGIPVINKPAYQELLNIEVSINSGGYDDTFSALYPRRKNIECRARYLKLIRFFKEQYMSGAQDGSAEICGIVSDGFTGLSYTEPNLKTGAVKRAVIISAPGRTEICGNHTDHQHGNVLAAAIDLDIICVAAVNGSDYIRVNSEGHPGICVRIDEMNPLEAERGDASALIRGLTAWFIERGVKIRGFDAYTTSEVLVGSGLSSSAAFEVVVGTTMNALFGGGISPLDIAIAGQYAENQYFGKPSGLMDQTASSVGGFVKIDFADPKNPEVEPIQCDLSANGLRLCVVNTKGNHANLIGEYASIPAEMYAVASFFGKRYLREVDEGQFNEKLAAIRDALHAKNLYEPSGSGGDPAGAAGVKKTAGGDPASAETETPVAADRAILRAMHFFRENRTVNEAAAALRAADIDKFLDCLIRSGQSSFTYLQNIFAASQPGEQGLSIALALSESILRGQGGAWRVTGGGFAGTIMALMPEALHDEYKRALDAVFSEGACITLSIRNFGGMEITKELSNGGTSI